MVATAGNPKAGRGRPIPTRHAARELTDTQTLWIAVGLIGSLTLLNLALILAVIRRINVPQHDFMDSMVGLTAGQSVPTFTAQLPGGGTFSQADISDGRRVLMFVTPDCKACIRTMPEYLRLAQLAESGGPRLIFVSGGDAAATLQMFGSNQTRVLIAPKDANDMFKSFRVPGTPHFVLIDGRGVVSSGIPDPLNREWRLLLSDWETGDRSAPELVKGNARGAQ